MPDHDITVTRKVHANAERVWATLTQPDLVHTHFSPLSGADDQPENYHRLSWRLDEDNGSTQVTLVRSGAAAEDEAEQFKTNWRNMLDSLRDVAEGGDA
jgi:uncharacterized protein YndB with AHSA1/START domain